MYLLEYFAVGLGVKLLESPTRTKTKSEIKYNIPGAKGTKTAS